MLNDPMSNQVNPDEIHDLLAGLGDKEVKNEKTFELSPEEHAQLKSALGNADISDEPEPEEAKKDDRVETSVAEPFTPKTENLNDFLAWTFKADGIPDVSVDDLEKNIFFKALLNETSFELDIQFELIEPYSVAVRGLNAFEQKLIAAALKIDTDEKQIEGMHGFATLMQQYCLLYQVLRVNNKPFDNIETDKNSTWTFKEHVDYLRARMRNTVDKLPTYKLMLLIKAVIIFEIKQKLLHDGLVNRNFWKPQGIA